MSNIIERMWYGKGNACCSALSFVLLPLSALFGIISAQRRRAYQTGKKESSAPKVPVIIVGGITVGGSGKTPLSIALLKFLKSQGYKPGLISRGYKGHSSNYPLLVAGDTDSKLCGDEPLLIKLSLSDDAQVMVDPVRLRGARALADLGCDVILSDDGMQHYALKRDAEIVVADGVRLFGNKRLMPSGPLREGLWRLHTVDMVVLNGGSEDMADAYRFNLIASLPRPLNDSTTEALPEGAEVYALSGIGNPSRFHNTLQSLGFKIIKSIEPGDHQRISNEELSKLASEHPVVMTAKDAVKYRNCKISALFVLDVEAYLDDNFKKAFLDLLERAKSRAQMRLTIN